MDVKKHVILIGVIIALTLLVIATLYYPGGSQFDKNSIGYNWKDNYISNLFGEKAVNGSANAARFWAVTGMVFLSASLALFFVEFAKRIPHKGAAKVIKYIGTAAMVFTFLIATPLHDMMITISSTLSLIGLFYITVFVFKSRLYIFKILCVISLLFFYGTIMLYSLGQYREFLPMMQKIMFAAEVMLILLLHYFTKREDFEEIEAGKL